MMHPITDTVSAVHTALDGVGEAQALYLAPEAKKEALRELVRAEARLAALRLQVMSVAGDVATESGARNAGTWLAADQRLDQRAARSDHRLAEALDTRWVATAAAFAAGQVHLEQARVIASVLEEISDELDVGKLGEAEATLLIEAKRLDPAQLRKLGRHLVDIVDPDAAEEREAKRLANEEKFAAQKARFSMRKLGDGTTRLSGRVPDAMAHRLGTFLDSFAQPRKQAAEADGRSVPYPRLLARAFGDLLERIDPARLPHHGGAPTSVFVTMTLEQLRSELAAAGLGFDDDLAMTAGQARRLACEADIIPVVLGSDSEILDVGRKHRLHTPVMRRATWLRDKTCRGQGCDVPAVWCDMHHPHAWSKGGRTSLKNAAPLCPHHHGLAHDPDYEHHRRPDGIFTFHRRT